MRASRLLISGIVQGVGYRYFARRAARSLGLVGWVRNLRDGRVEAVAAGPEDALRDFGALLRAGPGGAQVTDVAADETELEDDVRDFQIRH